MIIKFHAEKITKLLAAVAFLFVILSDVRSQTDETPEYDLRFQRSVALTPLLQHSIVKILNNYFHTGKVYGVTGNDTTYLKDIDPVDTCEVETNSYDGIYLTWNYVEKGGDEVSKDFYFALSPKKPFEYKSFPVLPLTGSEMIVSDDALKKLFGNKIYEIRIKDDVNASNIDVRPYSESSKFIDLLKIDSATYYIKLKNRLEVLAGLSPEDQKRAIEGKTIVLPVGVFLLDRNLSSDKRDCIIYLKRERTKKSVNK